LKRLIEKRVKAGTLLWGEHEHLLALEFRQFLPEYTQTISALLRVALSTRLGHAGYCIRLAARTGG